MNFVVGVPKVLTQRYAVNDIQRALNNLTGASQVRIIHMALSSRRDRRLSWPSSTNCASSYWSDHRLSHCSSPHTSPPRRRSETPWTTLSDYQPLATYRPSCCISPSALCDYRSVDLKDAFPVARISPESTGETLGVKYNENHKWKYLRGMTPDEIVLIKWRAHPYRLTSRSSAWVWPLKSFSADSIQDESVAICRTPPRQSIKLQALVFYD